MIRGCSYHSPLGKGGCSLSWQPLGTSQERFRSFPARTLASFEVIGRIEHGSQTRALFGRSLEFLPQRARRDTREGRENKY